MAMERLFDSLSIFHRPEHRIYESEIIELSEDVNLILVLPPSQCLVQMSESDPQNCLSLKGRNDLVPIGLQSFEVLHLGMNDLCNQTKRPKKTDLASTTFHILAICYSFV